MSHCLVWVIYLTLANLIKAAAKTASDLLNLHFGDIKLELRRKKEVLRGKTPPGDLNTHTSGSQVASGGLILTLTILQLP